MSEEMNNNPQVPNVPAEPQVAPSFDYEKVASILDGKIKATEDSVLKGYAKQQGLTGDEMNEAIEMFKKEKASRQPDVNALNKTIEDKDAEIIEVQSRALYAETQIEAMGMATELGVEAKTIPFLMRAADLTSVITEGQVDKEKLKESLENVLKEIPQLKVEKEDKPSGFKIGADTSKQESATNEELAKIFGVSKK